MPTMATCPSCKQRVQVPDQSTLAPGACPKCKKPLAAAHAGMAAAIFGTGKPIEAQAAHWLGIAAVVAGVLAVLLAPVAGATGVARSMAWLGVALGGSALWLSLFYDDCPYVFPIAGIAASALSLLLVTFWIGADWHPGGYVPRVPVAAGEEEKGPNGQSRRRGPGGPPGQGGPGGPGRGRRGGDPNAKPPQEKPAQEQPAPAP